MSIAVVGGVTLGDRRAARLVRRARAPGHLRGQRRGQPVRVEHRHADHHHVLPGRADLDRPEPPRPRLRLDRQAHRLQAEARRPRAPPSAQLSSRPKDVKQGVLPLKTDRRHRRFVGRIATDNVSIVVNPGEVVGLIGTNGAGKTTFMNAVSGFVPSTGTIEVFGKTVDDAAGLPAGAPRHRVAPSRTPSCSAALTARETVMVALEARSRSLLIPSMLVPAAVAHARSARKRKRGRRDHRLPRPRPLRRHARWPSCRPAPAASSSWRR